ncbi:helix-turn-helix domain-containing protein [Caballeronia grimmiae]|uniref:helix-turn-helix domain-containing protein n=2 Tax=Caballeronia grimmiae TaxID=1071679 RepID=UPI0038B92A74
MEQIEPALNGQIYKSRELKQMGRHTLTVGHLERSHDDNSLRRAMAARLDRAMQRANVSSAKAAKWVEVSEDDVQFWRRGITVPPLHAFNRIARALDVDVHWLCTGQAQAAQASR